MDICLIKKYFWIFKTAVRKKFNTICSKFPEESLKPFFKKINHCDTVYRPCLF